MIERAKKGAFLDSSLSAIRAAKDYVSMVDLGEAGYSLTFDREGKTTINIADLNLNDNNLAGKVEIKKNDSGKGYAFKALIHNGEYRICNTNVVKENIEETDKACVEEALTIDDDCFIYTEDSSAVTITGYKGVNDACTSKVRIPSIINSKPVTTIDVKAFWNKKLTFVEFELPSNVSSIKSQAFLSNQLTSIVIPNSVTYMEDWVFANNKLTSISIPGSLTTISICAFRGNQLKSLTIPSTVTTIQEAAFEYNQLETLNIPSSVNLIRYRAFNNNSLSDEKAYIYKRNNDGTEDRTYVVSYGGKNKNIVIPNSITAIGEAAFENNELVKVSIPTSVTNIGMGAFNNNNLSDEEAYIYKRNNDGTEDKTTIISYGGLKRNNIIIPDNGGITHTIDTATFNTQKLTGQVTIPSSVINLGWYVFANNNITGIKIEGPNPERFDARWDDWGLTGVPRIP